MIYLILGLGIFAGVHVSTARGKPPIHEPRPRSDVIAVVTGVILYAVFLFGFHPYILHVPIIT